MDIVEFKNKFIVSDILKHFIKSEIIYSAISIGSPIQKFKDFRYDKIGKSDIETFNFFEDLVKKKFINRETFNKLVIFYYVVIDEINNIYKLGEQVYEDYPENIKTKISMLLWINSYGIIAFYLFFEKIKREHEIDNIPDKLLFFYEFGKRVKENKENVLKNVFDYKNKDIVSNSNAFLNFCVISQKNIKYIEAHLEKMYYLYEKIVKYKEVLEEDTFIFTEIVEKNVKTKEKSSTDFVVPKENIYQWNYYFFKKDYFYFYVKNYGNNFFVKLFSFLQNEKHIDKDLRESIENIKKECILDIIFIFFFIIRDVEEERRECFEELKEDFLKTKIVSMLFKISETEMKNGESFIGDKNIIYSIENLIDINKFYGEIIDKVNKDLFTRIDFEAIKENIFDFVDNKLKQEAQKKNGDEKKLYETLLTYIQNVIKEKIRDENLFVRGDYNIKTFDDFLKNENLFKEEIEVMKKYIYEIMKNKEKLKI